ncbi:PEP-CTERM sorting domain-containing protein [Tautonia plasticadhaerens]|uniref:Ice-binding protein C-terminal domain-containing protein n=1 Tax=Tautonia plasticadhaerens TaxID=2527974 RepID=A0A518H3D2_9BACT|nr:PEP-CTERM sorting domain-containing protein [Tautonia plasticadhaerens]QDV35361.1 hypothetical protein ElP_32640 [Tautonia plasticadhaerens]
MRLHRSLSIAALAVGVGLAGSMPAHGAFALVRPRFEELFDPIYEYSFDIYLTGVPGETFVSGNSVPGSSGPDFFTIYDVRDLLSPTGLEAGFLPTIQPEGIDPFGQAPPFFDDPNIPNITFTFFPPNSTIELPTGMTELFIGVFSVQTEDIPPPPQLVFNYGWQTSRRVGGEIEKEWGFNTATIVIPEPASWAMLGLGLACPAALIRLRWRARPTAGADSRS